METRSRNLGLALIVIALAQLMVVLDTAIVNIALPSIQRGLHFTPTGLEWVVNGYALAFGGLLLLGGRAGDLFGRRRMFIVGILVFTLGSLAGGFATSSSWLIAARVVQGVGGAIVVPTALSLVTVTFPEGAQRNRALGVYSAVTGAGGALGLLVAFIVIELRSAQPLMPLRIFANRDRSGSYAVRFAIGATLSGFLFFLTQFMQNILGYSPLKAGLAFLPITVGIVLGAQLASRFIARLGARTPMAIGSLAGALGLFGLSRISDHSGYLTGLLGPALVLSFGLGLIFVSTTIVAVTGVGPRESGLSSALVNVAQQLGGSMGLAVLGTIAATVTKNDLLNILPSHAVISQAVTAGYSTAYGVGSAIAVVGLVIAIAVISGRRPRTTMATVGEAA